MSKKTTWLIDHKASLSQNSLLNIDGSTWLTGICVLTADTKEAAMTKFMEYLSEHDMELLELFDFSEFNPDNYSDSSDKSAQIHNAVGLTLQDDIPCYVYAKTSEFYDQLLE